MIRLLALTRGRRRLWPAIIFLSVWITTMLGLMLPYDSVLRQSVRFNAMRAFNSLASPSWSFETWMHTGASNRPAAATEAAAEAAAAAAEEAAFSDSPDNYYSHHQLSPHRARLYDNIGVIIKSGYGTRHRVPVQLNALGLRPHAEDAHNVVVIGDYTGHIRYNLNDPSGSLNPINSHGHGHGHKNSSSNNTTAPAAVMASVAVHNVIAAVLESRAVGPRIRSPRAVKYRGLSAAIHRGNDAEAMSISRDYGWELDTMKFIPGLELAIDAMPDKDWYLLIDDDTFLVPPSLHSLLARLDPAAPLYIGNAVGDFRLRFAHGGSAVVLSRAAVAQLVGARAVVHRAYVDSLTASLGDRLLAATLMRVGIYLDERFTLLFNGARPHATRISADRFCLPLVSLHGLANAADMIDAGRRFNNVSAGGNSSSSSSSAPFVWGDLWALYGRPTVAGLEQQPQRGGRDFVGRPGDDSSAAGLVSTTFEDVLSADSCQAICEGVPISHGAQGSQQDRETQDRLPPHSGTVNADGPCLAWTWDGQAQTCTASPWFVVSEDAWEEGGRLPPPATTISGVPAVRLQKLAERCSRRSGVAWIAKDSGYYELVRSEAADM